MFWEDALLTGLCPEIVIWTERVIMAIHEAGWADCRAQLGQEGSWGYKEQGCSLRVCAGGLVAQGPMTGRNLYPALVVYRAGRG